MPGRGVARAQGQPLHLQGIQTEMGYEVAMSSRRNQNGEPKALKGGWRNNASDGELQRWLDSVNRLAQTPEGKAEWPASLKARRQVESELNRRRAARRKDGK